MGYGRSAKINKGWEKSKKVEPAGEMRERGVEVKRGVLSQERVERQPHGEIGQGERVAHQEGARAQVRLRLQAQPGHLVRSRRGGAEGARLVQPLVDRRRRHGVSIAVQRRVQARDRKSTRL